jgi:hypothetical protein
LPSIKWNVLLPANWASRGSVGWSPSRGRGGNGRLSKAGTGLRYVLSSPHAHADATIVGFLNMLAGCSQVEAGQLPFAAREAGPRMVSGLDGSNGCAIFGSIV